MPVASCILLLVMAILCDFSYTMALLAQYGVGPVVWLFDRIASFVPQSRFHALYNALKSNETLARTKTSLIGTATPSHEDQSSEKEGLVVVKSSGPRNQCSTRSIFSFITLLAGIESTLVLVPLFWIEDKRQLDLVDISDVATTLAFILRIERTLTRVNKRFKKMRTSMFVMRFLISYTILDVIVNICTIFGVQLPFEVPEMLSDITETFTFFSVLFFKIWSEMNMIAAERGIRVMHFSNLLLAFKTKPREIFIYVMLATHELPFMMLSNLTVCIDLVQAIYMRCLLLIAALYRERKASPQVSPKDMKTLNGILASHRGFTEFTKFLITVHASENSSFWKEVELLKDALWQLLESKRGLDDDEFDARLKTIVLRSHCIFRQYVDNDAVNMINISGTKRNKIIKTMPGLLKRFGVDESSVEPGHVPTSTNSSRSPSRFYSNKGDAPAMPKLDNDTIGFGTRRPIDANVRDTDGYGKICFVYTLFDEAVSDVLRT